MQRRKFLALLGGAAAGLPFLAHAASSAATVRRIGVLMPLAKSDPVAQHVLNMFMQGMQKLGWSDGKNLAIELQFSEGKPERLPGLAAELVQTNIDVLVVWAAQAVDAARKATSTIPIVITGVGDALGAGYVASLAHPGGNITGFTLAATDQSTKRLQLIKKMAPDIARVAVIWNNTASGHRFQMKELVPAAPTLGIELQSFPVLNADQIVSALQAAAQAQAQALLVCEDPMIQSNRAHIAEFAMQKHWPVIGEFRPIVDAGGLMSYGPDNADLWRRSAGVVDKILRGENAGDLPMEQPNKFEFVINLKTAKAIGVTVPQALLATADDVVE
jgi:putative tryptophan/tyrosine transport system substrate-binding protein